MKQVYNVIRDDGKILDHSEIKEIYVFNWEVVYSVSTILISGTTK